MGRNSGVLLVCLLSSLATQVYALGLGNTTVESALNQPLRVRIEIVDLGETRLEDVSVQLASTDDFQRFNIDRVSFLSNIRLGTEATPQGNYLVLTTSQVVREPYLSFILDTRWPSGRLLSEHTILLDLPVFSDRQGTPQVRQPISPVLQPPRDTAPAPAPVVQEPAPAAPAVTPARQQPAPEEPAAAPPAPEPDVAPEPDEEAVEPVPVEDVEESVEEPSPPPDEFVGADTEDTEEAPPAQEPPAVEEEPPVAVAAADAPLDAGVTPEPADAAETTVTATAADTLSAIALQVRPDNSVSLQQTMIAIQRMNPDGFNEGNINQLRNGAVLRIPSLADIQSIGRQEAIDEVNRQNQLANAGAEPVVATGDSPPGRPGQEQDQLSVVTDDDGDGIDASGGGSLDDGELAELDARIVELENQLALRQEEADRARLEREELQSRLNELDEQIAAAQEIIRLQDLQLAQLQESLAETAAQAAAEAAAQAALQAELDATASSPSSPSLLGDALRILTGNVLFMVLGLGLVVLLLVFLLMRRNKLGFALPGRSSAGEFEEEFFAADLPKTMAAADELDAELDDIIEDQDEAAGTVPESDPPSRASVLMDHDRLDEAANVLREALIDDGENSELRLMLAEVLSRQGDLAAFEEQADALSQENDPAIDARVDGFREALKPGAAAKRETRSEKGPGIKEEEERQTSSFLDDLGIDLDSFGDQDDVFDLAEDDDRDRGKEAEKPAQEEKAADRADEDTGMDLTFDLGGGEEETGGESEQPVDSTEEEKAPEPKAEKEESGDEELSVDDFDFGPEPAGPAPEKDGKGGEADIGAVLDFDEEGDSAEPGGAAGKEPEDLEIDSLDFEPPAVEELSGTAAVTTEEEAKEEFESVAFDTSGLKRDEADEEPEAAATKDENAIDFDFDKSEFEEPEEETAGAELETFEYEADTKPADVPAGKTEGETGAGDIDFDLDAIGESSDEAADDEDIDFDLDAEEAGSTDEEEGEGFFDLDTAIEKPAKKETSAADDEVDFDLDLDLDDGEPAVAADNDVKVEEEEEDENLDDLDFLSDDDDIEIESVGDVEELETLSDDEETATKLELAYAYQKMGDVEGAREILQEVVKEGSEEQVKEARGLLAALDKS